MRGFVFLAALLLATPAMAKDAEFQAHKAFSDCLRSNAADIGSKLCHAPSEIIPGLIGMCQRERIGYAYTITEHSNGHEWHETVERFMRDETPDLVAIILTAQAERGC